jgi:hypothetical protein
MTTITTDDRKPGSSRLSAIILTLLSAGAFWFITARSGYFGLSASGVITAIGLIVGRLRLQQLSGGLLAGFGTAGLITSLSAPPHSELAIWALATFMIMSILLGVAGALFHAQRATVPSWIGGVAAIALVAVSTLTADELLFHFPY